MVEADLDLENLFKIVKSLKTKSDSDSMAKLEEIEKLLSEIQLNLNYFKNSGTGNKTTAEINEKIILIYKQIEDCKQKDRVLLSNTTSRLQTHVRDQKALISLIFMQSAILGVTILLTGIVLSVFISRSISRPVEKLKEATDEVAKGNLDVSIKVESKDEIGDLAASFNQMIRELKESRTQLETRVAERTKELVETVTVLKQEITERMQTEKRLRETSERLQTLIRASPEAIIVTDLNGIVMSWNPAAEQIFGWSKQEVLGRFIPTVTEDALEEYRAITSRVKQGESFSGIEVRRLKKDGTMMDLSLSNAPLRDSAGNIVGTMAMLTDITERKLMEREVLEAKAEVELYLDIMAHDINNLNQVGLGYLELLLNNEALDEKQRKYASKSLESVRGSIKLIENVNLLKHIKGKTKLTEIDLNKVIIEAIDESSTSLHKKVDINYSPKPGLNVYADSMIKEIPVNLIGNSIKYSGETVEIRITVEEITSNGREFYKICVEDNGDGVPDEKKQTIFQRFERGTKKAHGKGLGLYIVKMLVEKYGGEIWVEDREKGEYSKGARFCFTIPKQVEGGSGK